MRRWLCAWLLAPALAWASPPVLVVDLSEAYARSTALAQLLVAVDTELKAIAQRHRPELQRLREELRLLKEQGAASRDRQLAIARRISEIEA
ncbi:MAG: hypothetical protein JNL89_16245, partial [Rhodanobacteraceae bacterium]|nr:hypothetical protein [Rhodanobacteraceae bacterium]